MLAARIALIGSTLALAGCSGGGITDLTEVEGTVLLNNQPLPHALVTFNPTGDRLPANAAATGVTDEGGKFKLTTGAKPGAMVGEHVVTVTEAPPPEDVRGEEAQDKLTKYQASLKNRPIPAKYGVVTTSGTRVTVKKDQKEYKIELTR